VLRNNNRYEFEKGVVIGFAIALVIIGPFGFFALNDTYPLDISRLQFAFVFFTAIGIFGFICVLIRRDLEKSRATALKSAMGL
jgi:hypothetical protein